MKVNAPDGTVINFPDSMSLDEVKAVMRQKFPPSAPSIPTPGPTLRSGERMTLPVIGRALDDAVRATASGATLGAADEIAAGASALTGLAPDYETALAAERARDAEIPAAQRIVGETAGMIGTGALLGPMAQGIRGAIGLGTAYGFGSGEGGLGERLEGAGRGGLAGAAGGVIANRLAALISPKTAPAVKALQEQGVTPTPGQALGGAARATEEKLTSVPILGDFIRAAETRGIKEFNVAVLNKALKPAGITVSSAGRESVAKAGQALSKGYDDVLSGMSANMDDAFVNDLRVINEMAQDNLNQDLMALFQRKMARIGDVATKEGGYLTGQRAKEIISNLSQEAADLSRSDNVFQRKLGAVFSEMRDAFSNLLQRSSSPDLAAKLRSLDEAYKGFLRAENAAARIGSREGIFTPAQLNAAVRQMDRTLRKRGYARGEAPMQDIAEQGLEVLAKNIPDSGTAPRSLLALLGGAGMYADPITTAAIGGGLTGAGLAYTPILQRALTKALTSRPAGASAVADVVRPAGLAAAPIFAGP